MIDYYVLEWCEFDVVILDGFLCIEMASEQPAYVLECLVIFWMGSSIFQCHMLPFCI